MTSQFQPGDRVYLYGDFTDIGILVRPIEQTYPLRWTIQSDKGSYEAVSVSNFSLVTSSEEIPKSDERSKTIIEQLQKEIIALKEENQRLKEELLQAKQTIRRAKDSSSVIRPSLKRVLQLAHNACMDVKRIVGGWILFMGNKARKFRTLTDIWDILCQDNWYLDDIFPLDKLISIDRSYSTRPNPKYTLGDRTINTQYSNSHRYSQQDIYDLVWGSS
ncbi:MAG: hypothetical protein ACRC2R_08215 [Xenococcaceae cyanobacterium]